MEPEFTPIDPAAWPRTELFHYFANMAPTGYSVTAEVDVTRLCATLRAAGKKFFPAYLWLVTRALRSQIEFRVAVRDGVLGYYTHLTPLYASFHEDDKTFSLMWTEYCDDFAVFYERYMENQRRYGSVRGALCQKATSPPENSYTVSAVPWIRFSHFAVHDLSPAGGDRKPYFFPSVEAGCFFERDGKTVMPLSLTCHHATTDGWHIHVFLEEWQALADGLRV